ncbi:MAG TPA: hypothetical protein VKU88_01295 [Acidimicrobiales bacterium]|nr:hypothetical protein [Acidimicrobiales bacterium]
MSLRSRVLQLRQQALSPVLHRLDLLSAEVRGLSARLDEIDALVQILEGRVATASERTVMYVESDARLRRRVEAIEGLLGAAPGQPEQVPPPASPAE